MPASPQSLPWAKLRKLCLILSFACIWIVLFSRYYGPRAPLGSNMVYISENALLPGQAAVKFSDSDYGLAITITNQFYTYMEAKKNDKK